MTAVRDRLADWFMDRWAYTPEQRERARSGVLADVDEILALINRPQIHHECPACGAGVSDPVLRCCSIRCAKDWQEGPPVCVCDVPTPGWLGWECAECRRCYGPQFADLRDAWRAHMVRNQGRAA